MAELEFAHRIFERQAAKTPQVPALEHGQRALSYEALDRAANALAQRLRSDGVRPDMAVGLYADRSLEMLVGFLGILKAGGTVLPLDATYPSARLRLMMEDSGARAVVAAANAQVGELGARVVPIDPRESAPPVRLDDDLTADHLAYIIYTSGSTGTPKGVMLRHAGLSNLVGAMGVFGARTGSRVVQFLSPGFDAFIQEITMSLMYGATLVLAPMEALRPGAELVETLRNARINVLSAPPSVLALLPADELKDLVTVCAGGEPLSPELYATWSRAHTVFNAYGPTEATVCATLGKDILRKGDITIGKPIDNVAVYLLDDQLKPVAQGDVGEIFIGGPGVARGYVRRDELTTERFFADPFSVTPKARMYRTGDLARCLDDGSLVFVGRTDDQVKVRGFRIELGEIECALREVPDVSDAAVIAREVNGSKSLVAFVKSGDRNTSKLETAIVSRLPGHMVPSMFVFVDALPLAPSGKTDRRALLSVPLSGSTSHAQVASTRLERLLVDIWSDTLGIEASDVTANFFEIGGDSLRAAMVTNRLQELLSETVYMTALLDHPTIRALAANLEESYAESVAKMFGGETLAPSAGVGASRITQDDVGALRKLISQASPITHRAEPSRKNPRAVFVLSPPRSGSTLFRVMLAGNRRLFVPQELALLAFETLGSSNVLSNGFPWMAEALVRTLMEIKQWTVEEAKQYVSSCQEQRMSSKDLFGSIQRWVAPQVLVDKTTLYAVDPKVLDRAEADFEDPYYIHLVRHPCGMIRSFVKARLDQSFFRWPDKPLFSPAQLAELVWQIAHDNIVTFLRRIPESRQCAIRYEDVVSDPRGRMTSLCERLGIPFEDSMTQPYRDADKKMVDGIYKGSVSRQVGDPFFDKHTDIDPAVAEAWRAELSEGALGDRTRELARELGYAMPDA